MFNQWYEHPTFMFVRGGRLKLPQHKQPQHTRIDQFLPAVEEMVVLIRDLKTSIEVCCETPVKRIVIPYFVGNKMSSEEEQTLRRLIARTLLYACFREWPLTYFDPQGMDVPTLAGMRRGELLFGEDGYPHEVQRNIIKAHQSLRDDAFEAYCNVLHFMPGSGWFLWGAGAYQAGVWDEALVRPDWLMVHMGFNPNMHYPVWG